METYFLFSSLVFIKRSILEKSSKPTKDPENNDGNKSSAGENIVKMSLSKSDVNGVFQFSKISRDNAKISNEKVRSPASSNKVEQGPGPGIHSSQPEEEGEGEPVSVLSSEGIITIILLSSSALVFLLYLAVSRVHPLSNCSYFPQDMTDKTEESDDQNNCDDEFVYISPLTSV